MTLGHFNSTLYVVSFVEVKRCHQPTNDDSQKGFIWATQRFVNNWGGFLTHKHIYMHTFMILGLIPPTIHPPDITPLPFTPRVFTPWTMTPLGLLPPRISNPPPIPFTPPDNHPHISIHASLNHTDQFLFGGKSPRGVNDQEVNGWGVLFLWGKNPRV